MIRDLVLELTSPLILGGAEARELDSPLTLRPPSLRGQLRFWTRALGGDDLERQLWGTTETGQRVRILGAHPVKSPLGTAALFPHKSGAPRSATAMLAPEERFIVRMALPSAELLPKLQAVVWTWVHLGALGRRSRRGYGAFQWEPRPGDLLDGFLVDGFRPRQDLKDPAALASYLTKGMQRTFDGVEVEPERVRESRDQDDDFRLNSLDQVFVGRRLFERDLYAGEARYEGADYSYRWAAKPGKEEDPNIDRTVSLEYLLHGLDPAARGKDPERKQLGLPNPRIPSPMIWRLHKCSQGGYIPVMTWSPVDYGQEAPRIRRTHASVDLCNLLTADFGFDRSLAGFALVE
jgi:hypothetical protein